MKAYTPTEYASAVWGDSVTSKTIRNWIKAGIKLKGASCVEITPTGHYVIFMQEDTKSNAMTLVDMMKAKAA